MMILDRNTAGIADLCLHSRHSLAANKNLTVFQDNTLSKHSIEMSRPKPPQSKLQCMQLSKASYGARKVW